MRIKTGYWKWLAAVVSTVAITAANAGSATFDFDDDPRDVFEDVTSTQEDVLWSEDGDWAGTGNPGGFLSITEATGSTSTTAIFPDIDNGELVKAFNLKMDIRTGNGSTDRPADGFSISYARAGDPVFDGSFSLPGPPENGTRTGIVVSFDTWQGNRLTDGSGDIEGIIVVVDGVSVNKTPLPTRHGDCDDITSLQTGPQGSDDGDFPRGDPGTLCWAPFEIDLTEDGALTVTYKGNVILDKFASNFFPSPGQLVIAGRTGGANEILHVDNIELNTILAGDEVLVSGLSTTVNGFTVSFREEGSATLDTDSIELTLDGAAVNGEISKDGNIVTVGYSQREFFGPGSSHTVGIKAAGGISKEVAFTTPDYAVIGADNALSGNFNQRGFLMRVIQANTGLANNTSLREEHLAGTLTDGDGNPLEDFADDFGRNSDGFYEIEGVINFDQDGNPQGVFRDSGDGSATDVFDDFIPGIPGLDGSTDNITAEILTVVEVPAAGLYRFAFNSDDGFKTTAGAVSDAQNAIVVAEFNGGRGASTTMGTVLFEEAGFYKMRTIWYEGGGGANLEWWTADDEGEPIALLNDDDNGGLKTYRQIPEDPASIASVSPADGTGEVPSNTTVSLVIKNGSTSYDAGSAAGTLNGDAIEVSADSSGDTVTLSAELSDLAGNSEFTWEISFTAGGIARAAGGSFRTTVLSGEGLVFIETEDFDFDLGKWDSSNEIGLNGAYPGGTYQDLGDGIDETDVDSGTSYGVDYFESNNGNSQAVYRPDTGVEAGKTNGGAGQFRGSFDVETNHVVGWNDGGDWKNFTRDFPEPARNYNIYGHLSSGGAAIDVTFSKVTSGVGTSSQETEVIGHWRPGRGTAGWDSFEIFPLLDDDGEAAVASLGGTTTLRYHTNGGNNDNDYVVFVPAAAPAPVDPPVVVPPIVPPVIVLPPIPGQPAGPGEITGISRAADGSISIEFTGTLQSSDTVDGAIYAPVAGASSPFAVDASGDAKFYIAR